MSTNWIFSIRKYSGDPIAYRFKALAEQIAAFDSANAQPESQDILNKMRTDSSINQFREIVINRQITGSMIFTPTFEPDMLTLRLWYTFESFGSTVFDHSLFKHNGYIVGFDQPIAIPGLDQGMGGSIAVVFNGTDQKIEVFDRPDLQLIGQTVGFSIATLIVPTTFDPTFGMSPRYLASKVDDPNNAWAIYFDTEEPRTGGFTDYFDPNFFTSVAVSTGLHRIIMWIMFNSVDYSVITVDGVVRPGSWYWIVATYNAVTNACALYVNGAVVPTVSTTMSETSFNLDQAPTSFYVAGSASDGYLQGAMGDFRYYREKVLSPGEAANLNLNMMSIAPIQFGRVPIIPLIIASGPAAVAYYYSIWFDMTKTQYINATNNSILKVGEAAGTEASYSGWFKTSGHPSAPIGICGQDSFGWGMSPYVNTNGFFACDFNFNTHAADFAGAVAPDVTDNKWHHFVVSNKATGKSQIWLDGDLIENDANGDYLKTSAPATFRIGEVYGTDPFNGQISDIKVYNVQLTAGEVQALYDGYDVTRGLVGDFRMTEGSGTTTTDSKNGIIATLVNGPTWSADNIDRAI